MRVSEIGEFGLIHLLAQELGVEYPPKRGGLVPAGLIVGLGDDALVSARREGALIWTTDTLVAGVHFLPETAWGDVGWKALAVNLSDVAAMGGAPHLALVTLMLPDDFRVEDAVALYRGLKEAADAFGVTIGGGDVVRAPVLAESDAGLGALVGGAQQAARLRPKGGALAPEAQAGGGIAKRTADGDDVAEAGGAARHDPRVAEAGVYGPAGEGDGRGEDGRADEVAAGEDDAEGAGRLLEAAVEGEDVLDAEVVGQEEGDEGEVGLAAHRGDVAEVDGEGFPADVLPGGAAGQEVDAGDERVGGPDEGALAPLADGGVVAEADEQAGLTPSAPTRSRWVVDAELVGEAADEAELADFRDKHGSIIRTAGTCHPEPFGFAQGELREGSSPQAGRSRLRGGLDSSLRSE